MKPTEPDKPSSPPDRHGGHIELVELERAQVGSEIHDGVLPLIFAASAATANLLKDETLSDDQRKRLNTIADWLSQGMQAGRQTLNNIYPPELSNATWPQAAEDLLNRSQIGSTTRLHWDITNNPRTNSPEVSLTAYRIVVEAVRNAVSHGKASDVWIRSQPVDNGIMIEIQDNGCGFEIAEVPNDRYGIRAMRSRAELLGGEMRMASQPGDGTTVTAELPNDAKA